jgi:1,4-alpha-glucan branching enzyme
MTDAKTVTKTITAAKTADDADLFAVVGGYHGAPHRILGPHPASLAGKSGMAIRAFRPLDERVIVVDLGSGEQTAMQCLHQSGFFEAYFPKRTDPFAYRLIVVDGQGNEYEIEDPYRFSFMLTDLDIYLHGEGNFLHSYEKLGAQIRTIDGVQGVNFAVWAPNAQRVSVIGPFNGWDNRTHPLTQHNGVGGIGEGMWEIFIPNLPEGIPYKFSVKSRFANYEIDKCDPYGFYAEKRPSAESRVWDINRYAWHDQEWLDRRAQRQALNQPINIYEVHLGSWRRVPEGNGFLNYRDLAHQLIDYAKTMGYTHIELMPITEHPFDGSWGYQVTGYFAPTSRFGTPDDFMYFIDTCHQNGIGVILDWVPAHFPKDGHGLSYFDGTHLYEHSDPRQGEHLDWGTKIFNFGRNEVRNFLLSSALFWLKKYHIDGLRVDAVASMLYLDYSRQSGEWLPNRYGGRENIEAIDFIRRFNEVTHGEVPGILTIAEESTAWPMVTRPTYTGGLGFDLKWNMGWMHDMLSYMQKDSVYRRYFQNQITFSLMYAFSENYVLPFSHDEVVHLKHSMLDKMPGDLWKKFANLRALYAYMIGHPGKKLLFMGGEFGQWSEWNENKSLDWHLLDIRYEEHLGQRRDYHRRLQNYAAALNRLYQSQTALYQVDSSWDGFQWIDLSDAEQSIISFVRRAARPAQDDSGGEAGSEAAAPEEIVIICNFTPVPRLGYRVGLPKAGHYVELLNSDAADYGGSGVGNANGVQAESIRWQNCNYSAAINLPPLGVLFIKRIG